MRSATVRETRTSSGWARAWMRWAMSFSEALPTVVRFECSSTRQLRRADTISIAADTPHSVRRRIAWRWGVR
jgi:hypothetical protein